MIMQQMTLSNKSSSLAVVLLQIAHCIANSNEKKKNTFIFCNVKALQIFVKIPGDHKSPVQACTTALYLYKN